MSSLFLRKSFYFVRHGETDWNKEQKVMGQADIPLNENGILQAQAAAEKIQVLPIDIIISSPLKRAWSTAEIIGNKIHQPITIENNLQECCWGIMEGKIKGDCSYNNIPFEPEKWWQQGIVPKGAESFTEFSNRVIKIINDNLAINKNVLFVAHGGVIMAILTAIGKPSWNIENVALYHFIAPEVGENSWNFNIIK